MNKSLVSLVALAALVGLGQADDMHRFCSTVPNGRFVSNPRSCQHWIFCQNERATEGQCPGIFHFDVAMQMCRYPEFVQCDFDAVDVTCPISGLELLPHPTTCHQYVACVNGFPRVANCAPGLHWDQTRQICDLPENTPHCEPQEEAVDYTCLPNEIYVTRHPNNCQRFIICVNGKMEVNSCANGLLFDPVELRCDQTRNVNCAHPESSVDYTCDPMRDFYFAPHPNNCNYFIACIGGAQQIERCAQGLIFDRINLRCDLPKNAFCFV